MCVCVCRIIMALHSLALPPLCLEEMGLQTIHILVSVYSELTVSTFHYRQCFFLRHSFLWYLKKSAGILNQNMNCLFRKEFFLHPVFSVLVVFVAPLFFFVCFFLGEATKFGRNDSSSPAPPTSLSTAGVQSQPQQAPQAGTQSQVQNPANQTQNQAFLNPPLPPGYGYTGKNFFF